MEVLLNGDSLRILLVVVDTTIGCIVPDWSLLIMKKIFLATSALLVMTAAASAADLPMKAPMTAPAAVYNWTGFYIGGNIGGGVASTHFDDPCVFCSSATPTRGFFTGGA